MLRESPSQAGTDLNIRFVAPGMVPNGDPVRHSAQA
jgi:hypothetical protein